MPRAIAVPTIGACANPYCGKWFNSTMEARKETCGKDCSYVVQQWRRDGEGALQSAAISKGMLSACRIYYFDCVDCQAITVKKYKRAGKVPCCRACARRRYLEHMARKNHKRRAAGPRVLSVFQIAERDGRRCHLCHRLVDMSLRGTAKWGPTIDHLVPVSKGGTNAPDNLALAHLRCNISRSNRGAAQLALIS